MPDDPFDVLFFSVLVIPLLACAVGLGLHAAYMLRVHRRLRGEIEDLEETVRELRAQLADARDAERARESGSTAVRRLSD
jgi:hypothetical protein